MPDRVQLLLVDHGDVRWRRFRTGHVVLQQPHRSLPVKVVWWRYGPNRYASLAVRSYLVMISPVLGFEDIVMGNGWQFLAEKSINNATRNWTEIK